LLLCSQESEATVPPVNHNVSRIEQDKDKKNLCWWAAAQMVAAYRKRKIRSPVIDQMVRANQKMSGHLSFLTQVGFLTVPKHALPPGPQSAVVGSVAALAGRPAADPRAFTAQLAPLLRRHGPLLTLITWGGSRGMAQHAVVVFGTDGDLGVSLHDPTPKQVTVVYPAEALQRSIAYSSPTPMMYMP
jgi:hypothetical protein